jgi:hypothetical protein
LYGTKRRSIARFKIEDVLPGCPSWQARPLSLLQQEEARRDDDTISKQRQASERKFNKVSDIIKAAIASHDPHPRDLSVSLLINATTQKSQTRATK